MRGVHIRLAVLLQLALLDQLLLALSSGALLPSPRVGLPVHDDSLGLADCPVVAGTDLGRSHLSDGDGYSLALGGHDDDLLADIDATVVAQDTRDHELSSVADGVDG